MREQLISFDTAKLAKEKGFSQKEFYKVYWEGQKEDTPFSKALYYKKLIEDDNLESEPYEQLKIYVAPTQSLLQKWLRDRYNLEAFAHSSIEGLYSWFLFDKRKGSERVYSADLEEYYVTYEEALEKGLYEALKITTK